MSDQRPILARVLYGDLSLIFYPAFINFLIHIVSNWFGGYGIFRDELYYLACGNRLDWGYVDQPPLSIFILRLATLIFGDSLFAIRLLPALCGGITVWLTGIIALRIGGSRLAGFIAALSSFGIATLSMMGYYSMNSIEIVSWAAAFYILLLIVQTGEQKHWITLGIVLGLGLLNKIGMLFLGAGIFAGLLFTEQRKWLFTRWPYITALISFVIFCPYIIWNIQHDFAHLEFIHNASSEKYSSLNAGRFLIGQVMINNPVAVLVWVPGLFALLFSAQLRAYRIFGIVYLVALIILTVNKTSKDVYLLPGYTMLWAAGGVWLEGMIKRLQLVKFTYVVVLLAWLGLFLVALPVAVPVMPVEKYIAYTQTIGLKPTTAENKELSELHQYYADMFGWEEKARDVAKVYNGLTPQEKVKCAIFASNYGRCAAIDYYGRKYGLPLSIGNHNNYWIWGPRDYTGEIVIILGGTLEDHKDDFESIEEVLTSTCDYCMPYENNVRIFLGRKLKANLQSVWKDEKHYD